MKEQFHIVLITVGLFVGGLLLGIWTQKTRPIPPPPAVLGEFVPGLSAGGYAPGLGPFAIGRFSSQHPAAVVTMRRNLAELAPRIREFQTALDSIEKEFRDKLDQSLTAEQRKMLAAMEAEEAPQTLGGAPLPSPFQLEGVPPPLPLAPPPGLENQPFAVSIHPPLPPGGWLMMSMIIYQPALGELTNQLKLDPAQQAAAKQLMIERRAELLSLIDKRPPPTLGFGAALP